MNEQIRMNSAPENGYTQLYPQRRGIIGYNHFIAHRLRRDRQGKGETELLLNSAFGHPHTLSANSYDLSVSAFGVTGLTLPVSIGIMKLLQGVMD